MTAPRNRKDRPARATGEPAGIAGRREAAAAVPALRRPHQRRGARLGRSAARRVPPSMKEPPPAAASTPSRAPKSKEEIDAFVRWEGEGGHPSPGASAPPSRDVTNPPVLADPGVDPGEVRASRSKRSPAPSAAPRRRGESRAR